MSFYRTFMYSYVTSIEKDTLKEILDRQLSRLSSEQLRVYEENNIFKDSFCGSNIFEQKNELINALFEECFKQKALMKDGSYSLNHTESLSSWSHVSMVEINQLRRKLSIDRQQLQHLTQVYIESSCLWCKELDWLFANSLLFAELIAYFDTMYRAHTPFLKQFCEDNSSKTFFWKCAIWDTCCFAIKWGTWLLMSMIIFYFNKYAGTIFIIYSVFMKVKKEIKKRKSHVVFENIIKTYHYAKSMNLNWQALWNAMNESRQHVIMWDPELYNLVELRTKNPLHA